MKYIALDFETGTGAPPMPARLESSQATDTKSSMNGTISFIRSA